MSYTRPVASAADASWVGAPVYVRPAASAADASWLTGSAVQAWVAVPSPLGVPQTQAVAVVAAMASASGALGVPAVRVQTVAVAQGDAPGPLGVPTVVAYFGEIYFARATVPSPLGVPQAQAVAVAIGRVAVPTLLGNPQGQAVAVAAALGAVPSALGMPRALAFLPLVVFAAVPSALGVPRVQGFHDFTVGLGDAVTLFVMDLVTPTGTVRIPISSWQATLQTGSSNYVQCVIPACTMWVDAINTATEFVIYRRAVLPNGTAIEYEMARAPAASPQFDQGPQRQSCTLSGYSDAFAASENPPAIYDRALSGIRSISSGSSYRVRCAVDWLLRPGHRAFVQGAPFVVAFINYYAPSEFDCYMDVGN